MTQVYLSLGSNLGDRKAQLASATALIGERLGPLRLQSSIYSSEAWGFDSTYSFLNTCIGIRTRQAPREVLSAVLQIEAELGRTRPGGGYRDRLIDIDILFYDRQIIREQDLVIPHPGIAERRFVLEPLSEIAPGFVHPVHNVSIRQLLERCTDSSELRRC